MTHTEDQMTAWWNQLPTDVQRQIEDNPHGNVPAQATSPGFTGETYWAAQYPASITHSLVPDVVAWVEARPSQQ